MKPTDRKPKANIYLANLLVLVTVVVSISQGQVSLFQRDQRAWLMQFAGTWQTIIGGDTEVVWQAATVANKKALQVHSVSRVNGVLVRESWGMWAFDPDRDRIVCMTVLSTGELLQATGSFAKRSKLQLTMGFVPVPAYGATTTTMELKPPDTFEAYQTDPTTGVSRVFVYTCIAR
jgi:hypothetical protein